MRKFELCSLLFLSSFGLSFYASSIYGQTFTSFQSQQQGNTGQQSVNISNDMIAPDVYIKNVDDLNAKVKEKLINQLNNEQAADDKKMKSTTPSSSTTTPPPSGGSTNGTTTSDTTTPPPSEPPPQTPPPAAGAETGTDGTQGGSWDIKY